MKVVCKFSQWKIKASKTSKDDDVNYDGRFDIVAAAAADNVR